METRSVHVWSSSENTLFKAQKSLSNVLSIFTEHGDETRVSVWCRLGSTNLLYYHPKVCAVTEVGDGACISDALFMVGCDYERNTMLDTIKRIVVFVCMSPSRTNSLPGTIFSCIYTRSYTC